MRQSNEEITNVITELTGKNEKEGRKDPITDGLKTQTAEELQPRILLFFQ